jgi:hypothetical protein
MTSQAVLTLPYPQQLRRRRHHAPCFLPGYGLPSSAAVVVPAAAATASLAARGGRAHRRGVAAKLKLKANLKSSSWHYSFKSLDPGAVKVCCIGSTCTAPTLSGEARSARAKFIIEGARRVGSDAALEIIQVVPAQVEFESKA